MVSDIPIDHGWQIAMYARLCDRDVDTFTLSLDFGYMLKLVCDVSGLHAV